MKTLRLFAVIATLIMSLFVLATASFADGGTSEAAGGANAAQALPDLRPTLTMLGDPGTWNGDPNKRPAVVDFKNFVGVNVNKSFIVAFFNGQTGQLLGMKAIAGIGGGQTKEAAIGVDKSIKCLKVVVDYSSSASGGLIKESNEGNNVGWYCY